MIIISSFRPFGEDPEWDRNQMMAFRTWQMVAKRVFLFGQQEPTLAGSKVSFVNSEQFPRIKDMAALAGSLRHDYCIAICNGDILMDPKIRAIEQRMRYGTCRCASSRRWHYDPSKPINEAIEAASLFTEDGVDDRGRDVFIARWDVWERIAKEMPSSYRIGHNEWDAFLTDKFREHWNERFLDFTAMRYIHHPHHGGRRRPYHEAV